MSLFLACVVPDASLSHVYINIIAADSASESVGECFDKLEAQIKKTNCFNVFV